MSETLLDPVAWLTRAGWLREAGPGLVDYQRWWLDEGRQRSTSVDAAGTPWLRNFDVQGRRIDEIGYNFAYRGLLNRGYEAGVLWRAFEGGRLEPFFTYGYVASFHDPGIYCPYTVSMATALAVQKYASAELCAARLPPLLRRNGSQWQGATWFTERGGGSDLGQAVATQARAHETNWRLTGEKYFCSNLGAELALVAARPEGAAPGVRGLGLFLVPRLDAAGELNYLSRRLKDKIATRSVPTGEVEFCDTQAELLSAPGEGIYAILDVLNLSRAANAMAAAALMQRAVAEACDFGGQRLAFGRAIIDQPLLKAQRQFWLERLEEVCAIAFEAASLMEEVRAERRPYSERHALFRLVVHMAKFWTAEQAVLAAKWAMEVHGGGGVLAEFGVERLLREAMILSIWEGAPQRHCLDALEVIVRKQAHVALLTHLADLATAAERETMSGLLNSVLALEPERQEMEAERLMRALAAFTARALSRRTRCA